MLLGPLISLNYRNNNSPRKPRPLTVIEFYGALALCYCSKLIRVDVA